MSSDAGAFRDKKSSLSLDLNSPLRNSVLSLSANSDFTSSPAEITIAQKQYAQGFFDALRTVHHLNNFEFNDFKKTLLSPGAMPPLDVTSPLTPENTLELKAIMDAIQGNTPILPLPTSGPLSFLPSTSAPLTMSSAISSPCTATSNDSKKSLLYSKFEEKIEVQSEESDRSRSSSAALSTSTVSNKHEFEGMSLDDQERRKLERKRARNRAAASKCRQKKMDRITELENILTKEKERSQLLDHEMGQLNAALRQLHNLMDTHGRKGCPPGHGSN